MIYTIVILAIVAYLLGSIPSAVWIGKHFYGVDVREHGSKNAGATNTLRVLGRRAAFPVFAIDFLKGYVAVSLSILAAYHADISTNGIYNLKLLLVVCAVAGHIFPIFAGFKGGKGVATLAGAIMGVDPSSVMLCLGVWLLVLMATNYVSLSSMLAGLCFPVFILVSPKTNGSPTLIAFSCIVAVLLVVMHRKNIKRLVAGTESKTHIFRRPPARRTPPKQE